VELIYLAFPLTGYDFPSFFQREAAKKENQERYGQGCAEKAGKNIRSFLGHEQGLAKRIFQERTRIKARTSGAGS